MNQNPIISIEPEKPDVSIEIKVSNEGEPGYTPQRGIDYWTDADKREIVDGVKQEIGELPGGGTVKSVNGKSPDKNGNVVVDPELPSAWDIPSADPSDIMPYDKVLATEFGDDGEPKWVLQKPPSAEAVRYTAQTLNVNQQAQARKNIGAQPKGDYASREDVERLSEEIAEGLYSESINLFDASQQTEDTISPHYWVSGAPYSTTQFDNLYHCTAPVPVKENTQYTLGCVPCIVWGEIQNMIKPWHTASEGVFFYGSDNSYLGKIAENTFTTPEGTAYIRFNFRMVWTNLATTLQNIIGSCMLVEGAILPGTYAAYGNTSIKENIAALDKKKTAFPVQYSLNSFNGDITVSSRYSDKHDLMIRLKKKGGNNLFDFYMFSLVAAGSDMNANLNAPNSTINLQTTTTDWHAPFQVKAVENIDGDYLDGTHFTGGNHEYTNSGTGGTATARTAEVHFIVDGREAHDEHGYCNLLEIIWTNYVQASNTKKADGTGREVLVERHRMTFDGREWRTQVEIQPLEAVNMIMYYGLQATGGGVLFNRVRYYGGANRLEYDTTAAGTSCGNKDATAIRWHGDEHEVLISVDPTFDAGNREFYIGTSALFTSSYGKAYCNFFSNTQMAANEIYSLRGSYVFRPYLGD